MSGHDFTKSKPDPEIFLTTSKRMSINPKNCAVIEDALTGIQAAKNAGMYAIGILSSNDSDISKTADFTPIMQLGNGKIFLNICKQRCS